MHRYTPWLLVLGMGCGDGSSFDQDASTSVNNTVAELVQSSLERNPWTEADRVHCTEVRKYPEQHTPGEIFDLDEFATLEGRQGDIYVVRACNSVHRLNGETWFDQRGECAPAAIRVVGESGSITEICYGYYELPDEQGGNVETAHVDVYAKMIGNVDYLEAGAP